MLLSRRALSGLRDADKERLRAAKRRFDVQQKFSRFYEQTENPGPGELRLTQRQEDIRAKNKRKIAAAVVYYADPIPKSAEFISGNPHKNSSIELQGKKLDVVRAIATAKVDTLPKI